MTDSKRQLSCTRKDQQKAAHKSTPKEIYRENWNSLFSSEDSVDKSSSAKDVVNTDDLPPPYTPRPSFHPGAHQKRKFIIVAICLVSVLLFLSFVYCLVNIFWKDEHHVPRRARKAKTVVNILDMNHSRPTASPRQAHESGSDSDDATFRRRSDRPKSMGKKSKKLAINIHIMRDGKKDEVNRTKPVGLHRNEVADFTSRKSTCLSSSDSENDYATDTYVGATCPGGEMQGRRKGVCEAKVQGWSAMNILPGTMSLPPKTGSVTFEKCQVWQGHRIPDHIDSTSIKTLDERGTHCRLFASEDALLRAGLETVVLEDGISSAFAIIEEHALFSFRMFDDISKTYRVGGQSIRLQAIPADLNGPLKMQLFQCWRINYENSSIVDAAPRQDLSDHWDFSSLSPSSRVKFFRFMEHSCHDFHDLRSSTTVTFDSYLLGALLNRRRGGDVTLDESLWRQSIAQYPVNLDPDLSAIRSNSSSCNNHGSLYGNRCFCMEGFTGSACGENMHYRSLEKTEPYHEEISINVLPNTGLNDHSTFKNLPIFKIASILPLGNTVFPECNFLGYLMEAFGNTAITSYPRLQCPCPLYFEGNTIVFKDAMEYKTGKSHERFGFGIPESPEALIVNCETRKLSRLRVEGPAVYPTYPPRPPGYYASSYEIVLDNIPFPPASAGVVYWHVSVAAFFVIPSIRPILHDF